MQKKLPPFSPGIKVLWFIEFNSSIDNKPINGDLYIPSPFKNEWLNATKLKEHKISDNLKKIEKLCSEIKKEVPKTTDKMSLMRYLDKIKGMLRNFPFLEGFMKKEEERPEEE